MAYFRAVTGNSGGGGGTGKYTKYKTGEFDSNINNTVSIDVGFKPSLLLIKYENNNTYYAFTECVYGDFFLTRPGHSVQIIYSTGSQSTVTYYPTDGTVGRVYAISTIDANGFTFARSPVAGARRFTYEAYA